MLILALFSLLSLILFQPANPTDIAPIIGLVMARALQLTPIVKVIVDGLLRDRVNNERLAWYACALGVVVDLGIVGLTAATGSSPFTLQAFIMAIFAGVLAGIGSKVVTAVHDNTHEKQGESK